MGAATAMLFAEENDYVSVMILDSSYACLD